MPVEALTFPLPRRNRTGPGSSLDLALQASAGDSLIPPRSRLIPFIFPPAGVGRRTLSTPLLIGPAILRRASFSIGGGAFPPQASMEFGWAPNLLTEALVALTTPRPYTLLTELQDPFAVTNLGGGQGIPVDTVPNTETRFELTFDLIVTEPRVAFTVSYVNNAGAAFVMRGHLLVLESVNPEALATFTGS